jgi:hypothetical protein
VAAAGERRADRDELARLGRELWARGLTARGLALWRGTATLARLPPLLDAAAAAPPNPSPAAALLELFVAGRELPRRDAEKRLGDALLGALREAALVEETSLAAVRARCALLPLDDGRAGKQPTLAVCDRRDAPPRRDATPWPDDSSHHLIGALGGRRAERWLDLGTGSGLAPLRHRTLARFVVGVELVVPTARAAALGAALSDHRSFHVVAGDLDDALTGAWDLVTCNAPIPAPRAAAAAAAAARDDDAPGARDDDAPGARDDDAPGARDDARPLWRHAAADFLERLCQRLPARVTSEGLAVVHGRADALAEALAGKGGDAVTVVYTPPGVMPFGVTWWQPHLPSRRVVAHRTLTPERPHLDERDRADAANNRLAPLPEAPAS